VTPFARDALDVREAAPVEAAIGNSGPVDVDAVNDTGGHGIAWL